MLVKIAPAEGDGCVLAALDDSVAPGSPGGGLKLDEHVVPHLLAAEEVFVAGRGAELVDTSGKKYLDFLGGIAVSALGHAHPALTEALRDQIGKVIHTSNLFRHPYTEEVAARVAR